MCVCVHRIRESYILVRIYVLHNFYVSEFKILLVRCVSQMF